MGRKKLEIKRIESKSSRQVTFTKRRQGLMKKAKELSILCDIDVGLIICSARGKFHSFSSSNNSLPGLIQRYHNHVTNESAGITEPEQDHPKVGTFLTVKDLLDAVERHLGDSEQPSKTDLICLENQLEAALLETRARQTHLLMADLTTLEEKEKMLIEENRLLAEQIAIDKMDEDNQIPETLQLF